MEKSIENNKYQLGKQRSFISRKYCLLLMAAYIFLILWICVFSRADYESPVILEPFWSYRAGWRNGHSFPFVQNNLENILLYVPLGYLIGGCFMVSTHRKSNSEMENLTERTLIDRKSFVVSIPVVLLLSALIGFGISTMVETLQFKYHRGTFEIDDFVNNSIGTIVGSSWFIVYADRIRGKRLIYITIILGIVFFLLFLRVLYLRSTR